MTPPRAQRRDALRHRRRMALVIGAVVVVLVVAAVAGGVALFGGDDGDGGSVAAGDAIPTTVPTTTSTAPTTAGPPATSVPTISPATSAPPKPLDTTRRYAVGTRTLTFEDTSRATSANGSFGGAPTRTLPTEFWYPAAGTAGGGPVADARPDTAN